MILLTLAASAVPALVVHAYHKARLVTLGNDLADYRAARMAGAVTPPAPEDGGVVPARDVYRDADKYRRTVSRRDREIARLRQVTYDLYDRLNGSPDTRTPRIPAPTRHRQGWRQTARWFTPWPQAAITRRGRA